MISLVPLPTNLREQALDFVCREFISGSVLHRAAGIEYDQYIEYMRQPFNAMVDEDISFIAIEKESDAIVGCLVAGDFALHTSEVQTVPEFIKPVAALLAELEKPYRKTRMPQLGSVLVVDLAVVSNRVKGQGIYTRLRGLAHDVGRDKGFEFVVGELSSLATQKMCVGKMGHRIMSEIFYDTFSYNGAFPFCDIDEPKSIQLVEGKLL